MKLNIFIALTILSAALACKTPYKATDQPKPVADTSAITTDTSASMNTMPADTGSPSIPAKIDSVKTTSPADTIKAASPIDSAKPVSSDTVTKQPMTDTAKQSTINNTKATSTIDSAKASTSVKIPSMDASLPESIKTAFNKQYPTAANAVWSDYDSLAAVPIDLRMAGWKKMDAEDHLVKFDLGEENYYAWYDSDGKWVGSAYAMKDVTKLPVAVNNAVKNAIKTRYTGYTVSSVNREFQKDKKAYEVELKKDDSTVKMLVNSDGKITQVFKYVKEKTK